MIGIDTVRKHSLPTSREQRRRIIINTFIKGQDIELKKMRT